MAKAGRRIVPDVGIQPFETWQVGAVRLPLWFPRKGGDPFRAWVAVCMSLDGERVVASTPGEEGEIASLLEEVLSEASRKWRSRPARFQVTDAALVPILEGLSPLEAAVELQPELPELSEILESLAREVRLDDPRPGLITGDGATLERLASFARAAADFYAAAGWRHLSPEDHVRIEAPDVPAGLQHFFLIHRGAQSVPELRFIPWIEDLQLAEEDFLEEEEPLEEEDFLDEEEDFPPDPETGEDDSGKGLWVLELNPPWDANLDDVNLWERHGLPLAGGRLIPSPLCLRAGIRRPDGRELAFLAGLLAALAVTTEEDLDAGRWEKQVSTADGPVRFVLSLPDLLEPPEEEVAAEPPVVWRVIESAIREMKRSLAGGDASSLILGEDGSLSLPVSPKPREPVTPRERAEALLDRAWEARGRRAVLLARQALEIWPDCADAYNLLAQRAPDPESAGELYERALAAGVRAMEPGTSEQAGHFWGLIETRPYMRAREGLAQSLVERRRPAEAAEHFQEMLRLNPGDNQGVRYTLVNVLISLSRDAEALDLLDRYREGSALMEFPRALLCFRREGDALEARRALKRALQANRFVPRMLLRDRGLPFSDGMYSPGSEEEADVYFDLARETWAGTPGALDWLRKRTALPPRPKGRSKSKRKKKRR
jgi:tetratricopeptide (TPR) repeat protein